MKERVRGKIIMMFLRIIYPSNTVSKAAELEEKIERTKHHDFLNAP